MGLRGQFCAPLCCALNKENIVALNTILAVVSVWLNGAQTVITSMSDRALCSLVPRHPRLAREVPNALWSSSVQIYRLCSTPLALQWQKRVSLRSAFQ